MVLARSDDKTVLTMVGVAVGLGNVWRFPYMMGEYGGSAFLVIYLLFTGLVALPALTAEWTLGRMTSLAHSNGAPMVRIFGPETTDGRGATIAMRGFGGNAAQEWP